LAAALTTLLAAALGLLSPALTALFLLTALGLFAALLIFFLIASHFLLPFDLNLNNPPYAKQRSFRKSRL
jgi:hypothetical protein